MLSKKDIADTCYDWGMTYADSMWEYKGSKYIVLGLYLGAGIHTEKPLWFVAYADNKIPWAFFVREKQDFLDKFTNIDNTDDRTI